MKSFSLIDFILRVCDTLPQEQFTLHSYFSTIFHFSKK